VDVKGIDLVVIGPSDRARDSRSFNHPTRELAAKTKYLYSDHITEVSLVNNASYLD
jgi:2-keto-3-deoxy-L-rhamnonate aldolase RhmA